MPCRLLKGKTTSACEKDDFQTTKMGGIVLIIG
jgi:hypothetical protein